MTETPKRRGRPPGAKNKPKSPETDFLPNDEDYFFVRDAATKERAPERLHVLVRFKLRTGEDPEDVELLWPKGWAIPTQGDTVRHGGLAGIVMGIEYDPERGRITLVTR